MSVEGPIPTEDTLRITKQICGALEYAHSRTARGIASPQLPLSGV
jgi:serine/threonine protein kinase